MFDASDGWHTQYHYGRAALEKEQTANSLLVLILGAFPRCAQSKRSGLSCLLVVHSSALRTPRHADLLQGLPFASPDLPAPQCTGFGIGSSVTYFCGPWLCFQSREVFRGWVSGSEFDKLISTEGCGTTELGSCSCS